jgi:hypothetical protein
MLHSEPGVCLHVSAQRHDQVVKIECVSFQTSRSFFERKAAGFCNGCVELVKGDSASDGDRLRLGENGVEIWLKARQCWTKNVQHQGSRHMISAPLEQIDEFRRGLRGQATDGMSAICDGRFLRAGLLVAAVVPRDFQLACNTEATQTWFSRQTNLVEIASRRLACERIDRRGGSRENIFFLNRPGSGQRQQIVIRTQTQG